MAARFSFALSKIARARRPRLASWIMLTFYWYSNCDTCRRAKKALDGAGIEYRAKDITLTPPSAAEMNRWLKQGQVELKQLLNTSGQAYRAAGMKDKVKELAPEAVVKLLAANGRLMKRPVLTDGKKVTVGFKDPAAVLAVWR